MSGLWPFFTFYGGKWRTAPRYPVPVFDVIVEPFAGSAGYAMRYPEKKVLLVDRDPVICETWRYLIGASPQDIFSLPLTWDCPQVRDLDLPVGAQHLIGWWLNKGASGPRQSPSAWMRSGIHPASVWGAEIRQRIASQVDRIKHWRIFHAGYEQLSNGKATWFIDPPYQQAGVHYRFNSKGIDYTHLAEWSKDRQGQVIVCENHGADWLPFQPFQVSKGTPGASRTGMSKEVVWLGY